MNTNSNTYTVIYATVLVVIVAAVLAFVSISLKDKQQKNIDTEKKQSILAAAYLGQNAANEADKTVYIENEYKKYITDSYVVNTKGEKVEGDAFALSLKEQYDNMRLGKEADIKLPVYVCTLADGSNIKILSTYGPGLWGPIWGYVALKDDNSTIYGARFEHKGETPGLGAEIATTKFQDQFKEKQIFENGSFCSVQVVKGGAPAGSLHGVDAISGGTITSEALAKALKSWFNYYLPMLKIEKEDNNE